MRRGRLDNWRSRLCRPSCASRVWTNSSCNCHLHRASSLMYSVPTILRCGQAPSRCGWCHLASLPWPFARASLHIGCLPRSSRFTGHGRRSHITLRSLRRSTLPRGCSQDSFWLRRSSSHGVPSVAASFGSPPGRRCAACRRDRSSRSHCCIRSSTSPKDSAFLGCATFGVPCPTTILTLGLLLVAESPSWNLAAIPIAWAVVAGSAAFLLGVHADIMLFVAAALLVGRLATRTRRRHHPARSRDWSSNANDDIGESRM